MILNSMLGIVMDFWLNVHDAQTPFPCLSSSNWRNKKEHFLDTQVYDMETSYLQDPGQCGNVLKGFEGFLSSSKNTALYNFFSLSLFLFSRL